MTFLEFFFSLFIILCIPVKKLFSHVSSSYLAHTGMELSPLIYSSAVHCSTVGIALLITPRLRRGRVIGPVCVCVCLSVTKNVENSCKRAI